MVGAVVFANEETILISDGTLFLVPDCRGVAMAWPSPVSLALKKLHVF